MSLQKVKLKCFAVVGLLHGFSLSISIHLQSPPPASWKKRSCVLGFKSKLKLWRIVDCYEKASSRKVFRVIEARLGKYYWMCH